MSALLTARVLQSCKRAVEIARYAAIQSWFHRRCWYPYNVGRTAGQRARRATSLLARPPSELNRRVRRVPQSYAERETRSGLSAGTTIRPLSTSSRRKALWPTAKLSSDWRKRSALPDSCLRRSVDADLFPAIVTLHTSMGHSALSRRWTCRVPFSSTQKHERVSRDATIGLSVQVLLSFEGGRASP